MKKEEKIDPRVAEELLGTQPSLVALYPKSNQIKSDCSSLLASSSINRTAPPKLTQNQPTNDSPPFSLSFSFSFVLLGHLSLPFPEGERKIETAFVAMLPLRSVPGSDLYAALPSHTISPGTRIRGEGMFCGRLENQTIGLALTTTI